MTLYSGGLRRSELINLKITDIDSKRMLIRITQSKGNKDRHTLLSEKLLKLLRDYYKFYKPAFWLYEGRGGGQYSATSIANIFRKALRKAKISKHATHLLEQGINLRYIQEILGHSTTSNTSLEMSMPQNCLFLFIHFVLGKNNLLYFLQPRNGLTGPMNCSELW